MSESGASTVRILHVKASIDRRMGGSATAVASAAEGTHLAGDRAAVLATVTVGENLTLVEALPSDVGVNLVSRTWPGRFGFSLPISHWLRAHVRDFDLVIIHEVFSFPAVAAAYWSWRRKIPYVIRPHGSLDPYDLRKHARGKKLLAPLLRQILQRSAGLWLTAQRESERVSTFGARVRKYVSLLPVAVSPYTGSASRFRSAWEIPSEDFVILFLGRIDPKKGLPRTIRAFESAKFERATWFVIAGAGEEKYESYIRRLVRESTARDYIKFVGFLGGEDRADAFAGSDLFVLYSDNENFGLAPVEALHEGLPSVLSDEVYVAKELVASGVAEVVDVRDLGRLVDVFETLSESGNEQLARMRELAADAVLQFEPGRVATRDHELTVSMIAHRVRGKR
ncbi:MAG: hypothetical protein CMH35_10070 [Microbacterium sp.]|nr:hypothetical protein [Microbacterium sp.]